MNDPLEYLPAQLTAEQRILLQASAAGMPVDTSFYERKHGGRPKGLGHFHFSIDFPRNEVGSRLFFAVGTWCKCLQRALDEAVASGARSLTVLA